MAEPTTVTDATYARNGNGAKGDDLEIVFVTRKQRVEVDMSKITYIDALKIFRRTGQAEAGEIGEAEAGELFAEIVGKVTGLDPKEMALDVFVRIADAVKTRIETIMGDASGANRGNSSAGS